MTEPVWAPKNGREASGEFELLEDGIHRLREEAVRLAKEDAAINVPDVNGTEVAESEFDLRERCRGLVTRLRSLERKRSVDEVGRLEEKVSDSLPRIALSLDRFERMKNDLIRLRVRKEGRKREVATELSGDSKTRERGIPTKVYIAAITFLGLVEFFANAPVFSSLLPRDPLTERQMRLLSETSDGWFAGAERVMAHTLLRPDAALLAAGVITFLCVLGHFFGHSLRELVIHQDSRTRRDTVSSRSPLESVVPLVISGVGLMLVLGVLFEARKMLGEVGLERYEQDKAQVQQLRNDAVWQRTQGNLLDANGLENRAEDMEAAAVELREYSGSMSRMSFPILLLNLTLVLCALAAAYFHRRDARTEKFNEDAFEDDRTMLVKEAEKTAGEVSDLMAELLKDVRRLKSGLLSRDGSEWQSAIPQLEAVIALYRAENGRARGIDPRQIGAFQSPISLSLDFGDGHVNGNGKGSGLSLRTPEEYEKERAILQQRFEQLRVRFNEEARS
jgi:hypothetical protein